MENAALIILFALVQYVTFTLRVGAGRQKFGVAAPKTMGNESWERLYRVQQNTMEQLVVLIPAAIAFSAYVSDRWVLLPGLVTWPGASSTPGNTSGIRKAGFRVFPSPSSRMRCS